MSTSSTPSDDDALAEEVQRLQAEMLPREDLHPYAKQWVALRKGRVVASHVDSAALRNHPDVRDDDMVLRVPDPEITILIL